MALSEDRQWLYSKLNGKLQLGTEEEFEQLLNQGNPEDMEWLHQKSLDNGLQVGSLEEFNGMFGYTPPQESAPAKQMGVDAVSSTAPRIDIGSQPQAVVPFSTTVTQPKEEDKSTIWGAIGKGLLSGIERAGAGMLDFLGRIGSAGMAYDPTGMQYRTPEQTASTIARIEGTRQNTHAVANTIREHADELARESMPYEGKYSFTELMDRGEWWNVLKQGVSTAAQSATYTAAAANPYTAAVMALSMAENNVAEYEQQYPDMPASKRGALAIGNAAIEMASERIFNPFRGGKMLTNGLAKTYVKELEQEAAGHVSNTILRILKRAGVGGVVLAESAAQEGLEEVVSGVGQDLYASLLDVKDDDGLGIVAQYERAKAANPALTPEQFAQQKGMAYVNDFIGGALSGFVMSGGSMVTSTAAQAVDSRINDRPFDPTSPENAATALGRDRTERGRRSEAKGQRVDIEGTLPTMPTIRQEDAQYVLDAIRTASEATGMSEEEVGASVYRILNGQATEEDRFVSQVLQAQQQAEEVAGRIMRFHEQNYNRKTGQMQVVRQVTDEGEQVMYVVDGNLVYTTDKDGNEVIDVVNSDPVVSVRMEDGTVRQVGTQFLQNMGYQDVNESLQSAIQQAHERILSRITLQEGQHVTLRQVPTEMLGVIDSNEGTVTGVDSEGNVTMEVQNSDGTTAEVNMTAEEANATLQPETGATAEEVTAAMATDFENAAGDRMHVEPDGETFMVTTERQGEEPQTLSMSADELQELITVGNMQPVTEVEGEGTNANAVEGQEEEPVPLTPQQEALQNMSQEAQDIVARLNNDTRMAVQSIETTLSGLQKRLDASQKRTARGIDLENPSAQDGFMREMQVQKELRDKIASYQRSLSEIRQAESAAVQADLAARRERRAAQLAAEAEAQKQTDGTAAGKFNASPRIDGFARTRTLPNGTKLRGRYALVSPFALTPSHDPLNNWQSSAGFPMNEQGSNINDRDYERDKAAQEYTTGIAQTYGGQAIDQVPTVSPEGIVYDGNGRTMAGIIAAQNNTDAGYTEALKENAEQFGFTPEQVDEIPHARLVMVTDEILPYNTETFAQFNQNEKKAQNNEQKAIALGKRLNEEQTIAVAELVDNYGNLDDFYKSEKGTSEMISLLEKMGIMGQNEAAGYIQGRLLNASGREYIENVLIGALLDEDAVKMVNLVPNLRHKILLSLKPILTNAQLGEFSLKDAISETIQLLYDAQMSGFRYASHFLRQGTLEGGFNMNRYSVSAIDFATAMDAGVEAFRALLENYNNRVAGAQGSGADLFGEVVTRDSALKELNDLVRRKNFDEIIQEKYEREKKQEEQQAKRAAEQQAQPTGQPATESVAEPQPVARSEEQPAAPIVEGSDATVSELAPETEGQRSEDEGQRSEEPAAEETVTSEPVEQGAEETSATEETTTAEPVEQSAEETSATEETTTSEPVEQDTEETPATEENVTAEPVEQSAEESPTTEEAVTAEPVEQSTEETPATEETATEESVTETPSAEEIEARKEKQTAFKELSKPVMDELAANNDGIMFPSDGETNWRSLAEQLIAAAKDAFVQDRQARATIAECEQALQHRVSLATATGEDLFARMTEISEVIDSSDRGWKRTLRIATYYGLDKDYLDASWEINERGLAIRNDQIVQREGKTNYREEAENVSRRLQDVNVPISDVQVNSKAAFDETGKHLRIVFDGTHYVDINDMAELEQRQGEITTMANDYARGVQPQAEVQRIVEEATVEPEATASPTPQEPVAPQNPSVRDAQKKVADYIFNELRPNVRQRFGHNEFDKMSNMGNLREAKSLIHRLSDDVLQNYLTYYNGLYDYAAQQFGELDVEAVMRGYFGSFVDLYVGKNQVPIRDLLQAEQDKRDGKTPTAQTTDTSTTPEVLPTPTKPADPIYAHEYYKDPLTRSVAHKLKEGDKASLDKAARDMARMLQEAMNSNGGKQVVLVPMPSRYGIATTTLDLAHAIARKFGSRVQVKDVLTGKKRESLYELKARGGDVSTVDLGMQSGEQFPDDVEVYLVDNVLATGSTMQAAQAALNGRGVPFVYAFDPSQGRDAPEKPLPEYKTRVVIEKDPTNKLKTLSATAVAEFGKDNVRTLRVFSADAASEDSSVRFGMKAMQDAYAWIASPEGKQAAEQAARQYQQEQEIAEAKAQAELDLEEMERYMSPAEARQQVTKNAQLYGLNADIIVSPETLRLINEQAYELQKTGALPMAWYQIKNGVENVYLYMPAIVQFARENNLTVQEVIDRTLMHECLAHRGLPKLLGNHAGEFYDEVWKNMSTNERQYFASYVWTNTLRKEDKARIGVRASHRGGRPVMWNELTRSEIAKVMAMEGFTQNAADEYIAHLAEKVDAGTATNAEKKTWQQIVERIKAFLNKYFGQHFSTTEEGRYELAYYEVEQSLARGEMDKLTQQILADDMALAALMNQSYRNEVRLGYAQQQATQPVAQEQSEQPQVPRGPYNPNYHFSSAQDLLSMFMVGNRKKQEYKDVMLTHGYTEQESDSLLEYCHELPDTKDNMKAIRLAVYWAIKTPGKTYRFGEQDVLKRYMLTVKDAIMIAETRGLDAMRFDSPVAITEAYPETLEAIRNKVRINPDDVPTLSGKRTYPRGVTVYDVQDSEQSRENMRMLINNHFGFNANPWCLLQGDESGVLTPESRRYWEYYNSVPKKVAFRNDKLLAFCAHDNRTDNDLWWDRQDEPSVNMPIGNGDYMMPDGRLTDKIEEPETEEILFLSNLPGNAVEYATERMIEAISPEKRTEMLRRVARDAWRYALYSTFDGYRDWYMESLEDNDMGSLSDFEEFVVNGVELTPQLLIEVDEAIDPVRGNFVSTEDFDRIVREATNQDVTDEVVKFSVVNNPAMIEQLNEMPKLTVYRSMQVIEGELYPPMAARIKVGEKTTKNGKTRAVKELVDATPVGTWIQADERPDLAVESEPGSGMYYFNLDKGLGKGALDVRYNPYLHATDSPLNDQFKGAYDRPNLVVVEMEIPQNVLTSGYKAEKAWLSEGKHDWNSGIVSSELARRGQPRQVYLSRYGRITRVVPDAEVAQNIYNMLRPEGLSIPYETLAPNLRTELEKLGQPIDYSFLGGGQRADVTKFSVAAPQPVPASAFQAAFSEQIDGEVERQVVMDWLNTPENQGVRNRLLHLVDTNFAKLAIRSIKTRLAIDELIQGRVPTFSSDVFRRNRPNVKGEYMPSSQSIAGKLLRMGENYIWLKLNQDILSDIEKCVNAVSDSYLNCSPSALCAQFCYATQEDMWAGGITIPEFVHWAVEHDPKRLAGIIAASYRFTPEYNAGAALRLAEKGDLSTAWVPVLEELQRQGIRCQVFTKRPVFAKQLMRACGDYHLVSLSIDSSNAALAKANRDLPIAFVYAGKQDIPLLESLREQMEQNKGVILPVRTKGKPLQEQELAALPDWTEPFLCPIDYGSKYSDKRAHMGSTDGGWNCVMCDLNGQGCFYKRQTQDRINDETRRGDDVSVQSDADTEQGDADNSNSRIVAQRIADAVRNNSDFGRRLQQASAALIANPDEGAGILEELLGELLANPANGNTGQSGERRTVRSIVRGASEASGNGSRESGGAGLAQPAGSRRVSGGLDRGVADRIRYSVAQSKPNTLAGIHNISAEKLMKAIRGGGLANPSFAVINTSLNTHEDYGEISLIAPADLIDKRTGNNAGTYTGDAWTPIYPKVEYRSTEESNRRVRELFGFLTAAQQRTADIALDYFLNGNSYHNPLGVAFLHEQGIDVPVEDNTYDFGRQAEEMIQQRNLDAPFAQYAVEKTGELGYKEVFLSGWSAMGNRIYKANTAENVSKWMNKQEERRQSSACFPTNWIVGLMDKLVSNRQIKQRQEQLSNREGVQQFTQELEAAISQIADAIHIWDGIEYKKTHGRSYLNPFMEYDSNMWDIFERITKGEDYARLNEEFHTTIDEESAKMIRDLSARVRRAPRLYFETKFKRVVRLEEFAGAVLPMDAPLGLRSSLAQLNIPMALYDRDIEGDRQRATQSIFDRSDRTLFSVMTPEEEVEMLDTGYQTGFNEARVDPYNKVIVQTSLPYIKEQYGRWHQNAKNGDNIDAIRLVKHVVKAESVNNIAQSYPNAIVLPVMGVEKGKKNKLPLAYAKYICRLSGLPISTDIFQVRSVKHTGASRLDRIMNVPEYVGEVIPGQEYILVDDHSTAGGTLKALKEYIENNGGKVVLSTTLSASRGGTMMNAYDWQVRELELIDDLYYGGELRESIQDAGYDRGFDGLTYNAARYLLSSDKARDNVRYYNWRSNRNPERGNSVPTPVVTRVGGSAAGNARQLQRNGRGLGFRRVRPRQLELDLRAADGTRFMAAAAPDGQRPWRDFRPEMTAREYIDRLYFEAEMKPETRLETRIRFAKDNTKKLQVTIQELKDMLWGTRANDKEIVNKLKMLIAQYSAPYGWKASEVSQLLTQVEYAVGKKDLRRQALIILNKIADNRIRSAERTLQDQLGRAKTETTTKAGVAVMASLGNETANRMNAFYDLYRRRNVTAETIEDKISEQQDILDSSDATDAEKVTAQARIDGYETFRNYQNVVQPLIDDIENIQSLAKRETGDIWLEMQESLADRKTELAMRYLDFTTEISDITKEGRAEKQNFLADKKRHKKQIYLAAEYDLGGVQETSKPNESRLYRVLGSVNAPLRTVNSMLKLFGRNNVDGRGYLYSYFMPALIRAYEKDFTGMQAAQARLNEIAKIYGPQYNWDEQLIRAVNKEGKKVTFEIKPNGEPEEHQLTQGNMLYLYMLNKMSDGRMKLKKMGLDDEKMAVITAEIDPRLIRMADAIQGEVLPELRRKYNSVHKALFGVDMAQIENYFPIKVIESAINKQVDLEQENMEVMPSNVVGNIIRRKTNTKSIDYTTDALALTLTHIADMERWAAFAGVKEDFNTLLSYRRFRNKVQSMQTIYGNGKQLWTAFRNAVKVAVDSYHQELNDVDKIIMNLNKGVMTSRINFNLNSALKQILSLPAVCGNADARSIVRNVAHPVRALQWCMKELPLFKQRWEQATMGNTHMALDKSVEWNVWHNAVLQTATKWGMAPNRAVDIITCAAVAKSAYDSSLARYQRMGFDAATADRKARFDANVAFNESQQSNLGAFISPLQKDKSALAQIITAYQNSNFSYGRLMTEAVIGLQRAVKDYQDMQKANKGNAANTPKARSWLNTSITRQLVEEGLGDWEQVSKVANREIKHEIGRNITKLALYGFFMNFLWELGSNFWYLTFGDDDKERLRIARNAAAVGTARSLTQEMPAFGVSFAGGVSQLLQGKTYDLFNYESPSFELANKLWRDVNSGSLVKVAQSATALAAATGLAVNTETISSIVMGLYDATQMDAEASEKILFGIMALMNAPRSNRDQLFVDEAVRRIRYANEMRQRGDFDEADRQYAKVRNSYREFCKTREMGIYSILATDAEEKKVEKKADSRLKSMREGRK